MDWDLKTILTVLGGLLAIAEGVRRWIADARKSRLLDSRVFEMPPVPESSSIYVPTWKDADHYLVGRQDHIASLTRTLQTQRLVFVDGPSGVGKSTLLKLGVARQLMQTGAWLPIYVDVWGADWQAGPLQALTDALQVAVELGLEEEARRKLGLPAAVTEEALFSTLERLRPECGRRPALIFDQLDDYQNLHGRKLFNLKDGTIISADHLVRKNRFWREIQRLLQTKAVHCVFAVRSDAAYALEAFRFVEPAVYPLYPLSSSDVRSMADSLAGDSAVSQPENGFRQLIDRVAAELERSARDRGVLPIQMRVVLSGLVSLRRLTPADLRREGGVAGLEAAYLERHLRQAPGGQETVLPVLRQLVVHHPGVDSKTISRSLTELAETRNSRAEELRPVLEALEQSGVLRRRLVPDRGEVWQLYHDYLARAVLTLDRKDRFWSLYLAERAAAFEAAAGLETWRVLLPPVSLLRVAWERLRGRLRLGQHRRLLTWSAPRLLLNPVVLLAAGIVFALTAYRTEEVAQNLVRSFDVQGEILSPLEIKALWDLSAASRRVRQEALRIFLENPFNRQRFVQHKDQLLIALGGMDGDLRRDLVAGVITPSCYDAPPDEGLPEACAPLVYHLDENRERTSRFVHSLLSGDPVVVPALAGSAWFIDRTEPALLEETADRSFAVLEKEREEVLPAELYRSTRLLAAQLGPSRMLRGAETFLSRMGREDTERRFQHDFNDRGPEPNLKLLVQQFAGDPAGTFAQRLIAVLEGTVSLRNPNPVHPNPATRTAQILALVAARLEPSQAADFFTRLTLLQEELDRQAKAQRVLTLRGDDLFEARVRLAARAGGATAEGMAREVLAPFDAPVKDPDQDWAEFLSLSSRFESLYSLRVHLAPGTLPRAARRLVRLVERQRDVLLGIADFGRAVALLREEDPALLRQGAEALLGLAAKLPQPGSDASRRDLSLREFKISWLGEALEPLADQLTPAEAGAFAPELLRMIEAETSPGVPPSGLPALAERLAPPRARTFAREIVQVMKKVEGQDNGPNKQSALGASLAGLARGLGEDGALLQEVLGQTRGLARPPCGAMSYLAGAGELPELVEVLKWPTCTPDDRLLLLDRAAELGGADPADFGYRREPGRGFGPGYWQLVEYLAQQSGEHRLNVDLAGAPVHPFRDGG